MRQCHTARIRCPTSTGDRNPSGGTAHPGVGWSDGPSNLCLGPINKRLQELCGCHLRGARQVQDPSHLSIPRALECRGWCREGPQRTGSHSSPTLSRPSSFAEGSISVAVAPAQCSLPTETGETFLPRPLGFQGALHLEGPPSGRRALHF